MQAIILFVIMALAISTFGVLTKSGEEMPSMEASLIGTQEVSEEEISQEEKQTQEQIQKSITQTKPIWSQKTKLVTEPKKTEPIVPKVYIDTYIKYGPGEEEVINETNKVEFEYGAILSPEDTEGSIVFETKVEGLEDWKETYNQKRTVTFPPGVKEYTFLVRAKIKYKDIIDPTPASKTFKINISPYFGKIKISSISHASINLNSYLNEEEKINITGWQIKGKKGKITIPKGRELFILGNSLPDKNIYVKRGDQVYLRSDSNPFKVNIAFRPNQCFGYLVSYYDSIRVFSGGKICPSADQDEICNFSSNCRSLISSLTSSCRPISYSNNLSLTYDSTCQSYIDNYIARNLNYEGCIENYYKNENFLAKTWYFFAGFDITCRCGDTIYLYDKNGLLVDSYDYRIN